MVSDTDWWKEHEPRATMVEIEDMEESVWEENQRTKYSLEKLGLFLNTIPGYWEERRAKMKPVLDGYEKRATLALM